MCAQGQFQPGRQTRWWNKHSVLCLSQRLQQLGSRLVVRRARESVQALKELVQETGAQAVFFNHLYDSISMVRDQQVKDELRAQGVLVSTFNADLLYEPWEVLDDQQQVSSRPQRPAVSSQIHQIMLTDAAALSQHGCMRSCLHTAAVQQWWQQCDTSTELPDRTAAAAVAVFPVDETCSDCCLS